MTAVVETRNGNGVLPLSAELDEQAIGSLPLAGQTVEVTPFEKTGAGYMTTILHVCASRHLLCELPGQMTPVPLTTPLHSEVVVSLFRDGVPAHRWLSTVVAFGTWGLGLRLVREVSEESEEIHASR